MSGQAYTGELAAGQQRLRFLVASGRLIIVGSVVRQKEALQAESKGTAGRFK